MDEETEQEFQKVQSVLDAGDTGRAQKLLDGIEEHNAEWFYLQSRIYCKKTWFVESRESIKRAIKLEPQNEKYQNALKEIEQFAKEYRKKERAEQKERERNAQKMRAAEEADATLCQALCEGICYFAK